MSGYVGDLSPEQEDALEKLKEIFSDTPTPEDDDHFYLRWLRARKFSVKKAEEMLRKHLDMRSKYGADTILQDWTAPEVLQKYFPGGFFGVDRDGDPVWYDNMGNLDFKGLHHSARKEDILRLKCQHGELIVPVCKELSEKTGRHVETITAVLDCENISIQKHSYWPGIVMLREMIALFQDNYPERIKHLLIVKAPPIFPVGYKLLKRFIDEETRQKIHILGDDWQEELQKYIAPEQLPQALGGTRCEPDPWCTDYINTGADVPTEYYLTNTTETSKEEMERVVVSRGSTHQVVCQVEQPGLLLRWEFFTTDYDISFGVYYKSDHRKKEVVPMQRRDSHVVPEYGVHVCECAGTYLLKFDNSYSWTRRKEVFYAISIEPVEKPPEGETGRLQAGQDTSSAATERESLDDLQGQDCAGATGGVDTQSTTSRGGTGTVSLYK